MEAHPGVVGDARKGSGMVGEEAPLRYQLPMITCRGHVPPLGLTALPPSATPATSNVKERLSANGFALLSESVDGGEHNTVDLSFPPDRGGLVYAARPVTVAAVS